MRSLITLFLIFSSLWAQAQIAYLHTDKDSILVGDEIEIKLTLSGFSHTDIQEINWDTLSNLEFRNAADSTNYPIDFDFDPGNFKGDDYIYDIYEIEWSVDDQQSPQELYNTFKIRFWEMCGLVIPAPVITLTNGETIQVGSKGLIVKSPFYDKIEFEKAPSFYVERENKKFIDYLLDFWWLITLILAIIIALIIRNRWKNRKVKPTYSGPPDLPQRKIDRIPPDVTALKKLKSLKESRMWETENEKAYVSELTEIIREYIENRFEIKALEMTSSEVLDAMKGDLLNELQMEQLGNTLNVSDMIKFAKSKADASLHEKFVDDAIDMVESSKEKPAEEDE